MWEETPEEEGGSRFSWLIKRATASTRGRCLDTRSPLKSDTGLFCSKVSECCPFKTLVIWCSRINGITICNSYTMLPSVTLKWGFIKAGITCLKTCSLLNNLQVLQAKNKVKFPSPISFFHLFSLNNHQKFIILVFSVWSCLGNSFQKEERSLEYLISKRVTSGEISMKWGLLNMMQTSLKGAENKWIMMKPGVIK